MSNVCIVFLFDSSESVICRECEGVEDEDECTKVYVVRPPAFTDLFNLRISIINGCHIDLLDLVKDKCIVAEGNQDQHR